MGCATISERTFFHHQTKYLYPTISAVWEKHQAMLLAQLRREKRALVIGGDGRADSPGHSAKFGSYTVMELEKQIVVDVQLVQVSIRKIGVNVTKIPSCVHRAMKLREATIWRWRGLYVQ